MFKIISKKEYERLQRYKNDERDWKFLYEKCEEVSKKNKELKERNKFLENELDGVSFALQTTNAQICEYMQEAEKYKKLYYDEFQKRLELAGIVKRMEDAE